MESTTNALMCAATGCWGWVFAGVHGVMCVHLEGRSVLGGCRDKAQRHVPDRYFLDQKEMAMRYLCGGCVVREKWDSCFGARGKPPSATWFQLQHIQMHIFGARRWLRGKNILNVRAENHFSFKNSC